MKTEQTRWSSTEGWIPHAPGRLPAAQLVLVFGGRKILETRSPLDQVHQAYPQAHVTGCSTAGEICGTEVFDDTLVVTAIEFQHTRVRCAFVNVAEASLSTEAGSTLAERLDPQGLRHILLLSDGLGVNGSEVVQGLTRGLPSHVTVTGGLSGDGARFEKTLVLVEGQPQERVIAGIGLYGDRLRVGCGSLGGWDPFGPERLVTRSRGNVLYELDGQSALELYKRYLGDQARDLPASGLLFPLSIRAPQESLGLVRTILSVNDVEDSMTFAGDVPEGSYARLMKANFDRLIDGATGAAKISAGAIDGRRPEVAILISCVGRKMVLQQRIEEEVEAVRDVLGPNTLLTGFYSYGEISPFTPDAKCELHNQTMTITTLGEE